MGSFFAARIQGTDLTILSPISLRLITVGFDPWLIRAELARGDVTDRHLLSTGQQQDEPRQAGTTASHPDKDQPILSPG
jgi:hypothetical protein